MNTDKFNEETWPDEYVYMLQREVPRLKKEIAALEAEVSALREMQQWVPVSKRLPANNAPVMAYYKNRLGNGRRIRAKYIARFTEESGLDDDCDYEWSEDEETAWIKEGWYEVVDNWEEYGFFPVWEGDITHWMPLPPSPDAMGEKE